MLYVYRFLWPLRLGWLLVCCLYKDVYLQIFKRVSFSVHGCCVGGGEIGPVNQDNYTSWVAVVTPTDRPKSVRNRCVIELFCGVVCVVTLPFWHFCWCRGFCQRTESYLFLFLFTWFFLPLETKISPKLDVRRNVVPPWRVRGQRKVTTSNFIGKKTLGWGELLLKIWGGLKQN